MSNLRSDITDAKEKKNHLMANLYDNLPTAVYTCNKDGYITSFNRAAVKLWGRAPEIGNDLWCGSWKIFYPDGSPLPLDSCPMAVALKTGVAVTGEEILVERPDGTRRNVLPYPVPTFDSSGEINGAINTLVDLTEQKIDNAKQAMLAAIIESTDDAIITKTLEGNITTWNKAARRMFGYSEEEVIGKHISLLIPDDRLQEEDFILGQIRSGNKVDHYETIRRTKGGKYINISLTVSPVRDTSGRVIGASKIARDITAQKETEERLKKHAENLEVLNSMGKVIIGNLDVKVILQKVTDATTTLTGAAFGAFFYNTVDDGGEALTLFTLSGAPREAFEKFGISRNTEAFQTAFSGSEIYRSDDITKDPGNGKTRPHYGMHQGDLPVVSYLAVPVISQSGAVMGGLFYGHPEPAMFTEEHEKLVAGVAYQAALALDNARLYEEVKSLNAKKDEFIGLASHELKTPVTTISGYVQIMAKNLPDGSGNKRFAQKAIQQIDKLSALVSDLLDVSKVHVGNLSLLFSHFDLIQVLKEIVEGGRYTNNTHTLVLDCNLNEVIIHADKQRIEQVINNLISNAIKYSPQANRVIITVSCIDNKVRVAVRDFGIGIPKEQQQHIFSRFYRVESAAHRFSGLGIGLYITYEMVKRHNGRIWVDSKTGTGSTFIFEIPIEQESESPVLE